MDPIMTIKNHAYLCLVLSLLSFIAFTGVAEPVFDANEVRRWCVASGISAILTAVATWAIERRWGRPNVSNAVIGNSPFEKVTSITCVWLPIAFAAYAILSVLYLNAPIDDVGWIMVVLAGNVGYEIVRIYLWLQSA
jgi:hypothetical protein